MSASGWRVTANPVADTDFQQDLEICPVDVQECEWLQQLSDLRRENEELKQLVTTDPLTGLFNYRYFEEILGSEIQRTSRTGRPTSLVIVDLDHFKTVNDERGHEAGNAALKAAATVFREELRQFDIISRYGGEEFTLILPQTGLPIAVNVAERIRVCLERTPIRYDGDEFNVTASFGVSIFQQGSDMSAKAFVDSADKFLYQAKEAGRNRVCHEDFSAIKPETAVSREEKSALFSRRKGSSNNDED